MAVQVNGSIPLFLAGTAVLARQVLLLELFVFEDVLVLLLARKQ